MENTIGKLSEKERAICELLNRFNQLRSYPLSVTEVLEWKDSIIKLLGNSLDLEAIDFAIDKMILGEIEYDKNKGIQNIFSALKEISKTDQGYKIKDFTW